MRSLGRWAVLFFVVAVAVPLFAVCPAGPPTLFSPAYDAIVPFGNVTLDWDTTANATTFDVWLRYEGDSYSSPTLTTNAPTSQGNVVVGAGRSMYWKVVAKAPSCPDQISAEGHFHTACPTVAPVLQQPAPGRSFHLGTPITFNWTAVPGAASYDLKLTPDFGETWEVFEEFINGTSFTTDDIPVGDWGWEIRANFDGECDPMYSEASHFFVVDCDNEVPEIEDPSNGETVRQPFNLTWTDVDASSYRVFAKKANTSTATLLGTTDRRSMAITGLDPGSYQFSITAVFETCDNLTSSPINLTLSGDESCPTNPGKATLLAPANGATNLTSPVTFSWNAVANAKSYRVLASFNNEEAVILGTTTQTTLTAAVPKGSGYWVVQTLFGDDCPTTLSERRTLTVAVGASCGTVPPNLLSPANNATNVASPVNFTWSAVPGAIGYVLRVGVDANDLEIAGATDATSLSRLVPNGKVYWNVTARFAACDEARSATSSFTAGATSNCPTGEITINAPAAGAEVASPVHVAWSAINGVQFYRVWASIGGSAPGILARTTSTEADINLPRGDAKIFIEGVKENCPSIISAERSFRVKSADNCGTRTAPVLVSPVGTREKPATPTNPVTLKWNAVEGAIAYRVWLAEANEPFADVAITTQTQIELTLDADPYAWYVQAFFAGCDPIDSAKTYFTIARTDECNDTPATLMEPAANAAVDANVTFRWTAVEDASFYRVYVAKDGEEPLLIGKTSDTQLARVLPPGAYLWSVESVFNECPATRSARSQFSVARSQNCTNTPPELLAPPKDATLTEHEVDFVWSPVSGAIRYALLASVDGGAETLLGLTESTHLVRKLPAGRIAWRVIAFFAGCDPVESTASTFRINESTNCANRAPILLLPEDGVSVPSPVKLAWTEVPRATGYKVWVIQPNSDPTVVAAVTGATATITLPPGHYEWYVQAQFTGCPPTESAHSSLTVTAAQACGTPRKPEAQVIGQAISGTDYRVRWTPLPNVTLYEVQESTSLDFANAQTFKTDDFSLRFTHEVTGNPVQYLYRVRGVSNCSDARGPYSDVVGVFVTAAKSTNGSTEVGAKSAVVQKITLPGGTTPLQFTATSAKPWITVTPSNGTLPIEGTTLTVTADPSVLALGTNTGTINIQYSGGSSSGFRSEGGTVANIPFSVSLVTPVIPTGQGTPPPDALIFPIVGHAVGANNSLFESDIRVTNLTANTMKYDVHFTPSGVDGTQSGTTSTIELAPNETMALDDIVASLFGTGTTSSATGMLEVRPITTASSSNTLLGAITESALKQLNTVASSRTYNFTPNGTFGQYIPAIPFSEFVGRLAESGAANILSLQQVSQSTAFRSNFGFAEAAGEPVDLQVRVYDAANTLLSTLAVSLQAREHRQINNMLGANGINNLQDGRVEVQVMNGNGKVTAYVSSVDNQTNDPLLVNATLLGNAITNRTVVPGMAFIDNGVAFWVSDLRVFNSSNTATPATLTFYPQGNPGSPLTREITLNPGEIKVLDNVIGSLFGQPNGAGGAIAITTPENMPIVATARTYNKTSAGTYGQFIPGITPIQSAGLGDRALQILQLEQSSRFRTNIGVTETTGAPVTVDVSVITPDSLATPVVTIPLAANEFRQFSLAQFGLTDAVYNARVTVKVTSGSGKVTAYGSAIDLITQDPTYVPAQ